MLVNSGSSTVLGRFLESNFLSSLALYLVQISKTLFFKRFETKMFENIDFVVSTQIVLILWKKFNKQI